MFRINGVALVVGVVLLATPVVVAQPICQISDGDAVFQINADGTFDFLPDGKTDHLAQVGVWTRRLELDNQEFPASNIVDFSCAGNSAEFLFSEPSFDLLASITIVGGPGPGQATLDLSETFTNTDFGTLEMATFTYVDLDMRNTPPDDIAEFVTSDLMRVTDTVSKDFGEFQINGADAYQAAEWPELLNLLSDSSADDLDNSGLPFGPGDFEGAYQVNLSLPENGEATVTGRLAVNVPEPGTLGLLALGMVAFIRRGR